MYVRALPGLGLTPVLGRLPTHPASPPSQVHVYTVEPHPEAPDAGFFTGRVEEHPWSDARNPRTFDGRARQARRIREDLHPSASVHLAIDQLEGAPAIEGMDGEHQANNPLWCSYGRNSRSAWLISPNGTVVESQVGRQGAVVW